MKLKIFSSVLAFAVTFGSAIPSNATSSSIPVGPYGSGYGSKITVTNDFNKELCSISVDSNNKVIVTIAPGVDAKVCKGKLGSLIKATSDKIKTAEVSEISGLNDVGQTVNAAQ